MPLSPRFEKAFDKSTTLRGPARAILTVLPPFTFIILSIAGVIGSLWVDRALGLPSLLPVPYHIVVSVPYLLVGSALVTWCTWIFKLAKGTPVPFNPPQLLVTSGPYRYSRNPMVLGWFICVFGVGLILNSITILCVVLPLLIVLMSVGIREVEEPQLERRFGRAYTDYKAQVPRFFPRLRR